MTISFIIIMGTSLVCMLAMLVGGYKMFQKAGEKGWKVLVPFYNTYTLFKLVADPVEYWIRTVVEILTIINALLLPYLSGFLFTAVALTTICGISIFITCHINVIFKVVEAFNYPCIVGIGLVMFTGIFSFLIGFGESDFDRTRIAEWES